MSKLWRVERFSKNTATNKFDSTQPMKEISLLPIFQELNKLAFIRNQVGAHFNQLGSDVTDGEVEALGKWTLELAESLTCPEAGGFPDRDKSGSYWETRNGSVRLHPLREPTN